MKKILFLLFLLLLAIFFNNNGVLAIGTGPTIDTSGTGGSGQVSALCTSERCANTVDLTITNNNWQNTNVSKTIRFSDTAIFGMRITIVDKNNNKISKYDTKNFWANENMRDIIRYNGVIVRRNNSYSDITDPTEKLYAESSYLRELDLGKGTYASFINSLNADDVEKILKKINSSLTLTSAADLGYYLKIEPIFVFHYKNISDNPPDHYFAGTVSEILYMIKDDKSSYGINYYSLGAISCGDKIFKGLEECDDYGYEGVPIIFQENYNVLRNFIISIYMKDKESGTSFPYYGSDATLEETITLYNAVMKKNSALSVGYVWLNDFSKNSNSVTITKRMGFPTDSGDGKSTLEGDACFQLLKKNSNGKYEKYLEKKCVNSGKNDGVLANHQVIFKDLPAGQYKIREVDIDTSKIGNVSFRGRTNKVGEYINPYGEVIPSSGVADSNEFKVEANGKYYFAVYNQLKNKVTITKKTGFPSGVGDGKSTLEGYACFQLLKKNSNGKYEKYLEKKCVNSGKNDGVLANHQVIFRNLPAGQYKIREVDIDTSKIGKVSFRKRTDTPGEYINPYGEVIPSSGIADSNEFEVKGNGEYYFAAYNQNNSILSSIIVTKRKGLPKDVGNGKSSLEGFACFQLLKKNSNGVFELYSQLCNNDEKYESLSNDDEKRKFQQVVFNNLPSGDYKLKEITIDKNIEKVYFRQRTETEGDYSINKDVNIYPSRDSNSSIDRYVVSEYFTVDKGKKYYFSVYNYNKSDAPDTYNIRIDKYFTDIGSPKSNKKGSAYFCLFKEGQQDAIKCIEKYDNNINSLYFKDLDKGRYKIVEVDVAFKNFAYVKFEVGKSISSYSILGNEEIKFDNLYNYKGNDYHSAVSEWFDVDEQHSNMNKTVFVRITNYTDIQCEVRLKNLKKAYCGDEGATFCSEDNKVAFINELNYLYEDYKDKNFNLLFNYKFADEKNLTGNLDISGVSCENVSCNPTPYNPSDEFYCSSGYFNSIKTNDETVQDRVCLLSDDSNNSEFGHCSYSFKYGSIKFANAEKVKVGTVLWQNPMDSYVGDVDVSIKCEGIFDPETVLQSLNLDYFDNFIPDFTVSWYTNKDKSNLSRFTQDLFLEEKSGNVSKDPNYICSSSNCYAKWENTYKFSINYSKILYTNADNGIFYYDKEDGFVSWGYGLPISLYGPAKKDNANLHIRYSNDGKNVGKSVDCPYEVTGPPDDDDPDEITFKDNLNFRIIDINNPFPGINAEGRLVGDNWCVDSRIGTFSSDKEYMIGDVNRNDNKISTDELVDYSEFSKFNIKDHPEADVDGDGDVSYSKNCDDNFTDYCIFKRYLDSINGLSDRNINCTSDPQDNIFVGNYIVDAPNSNSTDTPMYSFTLTPGDISLIRDYNKSHAYSEANFENSGDGNHYLSKFLTNLINNRININGRNKSVSIVNRNNSSCYTNRSKNGVSFSDKWCSNN